MNICRKKRQKVGLSVYTIAKELGVSYDDYLKIEKKNIGLEGEMLDKFNSIIDRAREINFNRNQKLHEIDEEISNGSLRELMAKRGYNGLSLSRALQIDNSQISNVLTGKGTNDNKERVYDFLRNPISQLESETNNDESVEKFEFDIEKYKKIIKRNCINHMKLSEALGLSYSYIAKCFQEKHKGEFTEAKKKIADYLDNLDIQREEDVMCLDSDEDVLLEESEKNDICIDEVQNERKQTQTNANDDIVCLVEEQSGTQNETQVEQVVKGNRTIIDELVSRNTKLIKENESLTEKLHKAERQIMLYEKLIERLN